jgi:hypothetical protein
VVAGVSCGGVVVALSYNFSTKFEILGDVDAAAMIDESIVFFPFGESVNQFGGPSASKLLKTF